MVSLTLLLLVQKHFAPLDDALGYITLAGDPKYIFLYLPALVLVTLGAKAAIRIAIATLAADFLNAVAKWIMIPLGDRPYWYDPRVREFHMTCETGYGMPSGHAMVTAAAWFSLAFMYRQQFKVSHDNSARVSIPYSALGHLFLSVSLVLC